LWLARVLVELMPNEPEPRGLFALMLHCEARRSARRSPDGRYVPIAEQDTTLWSSDLMGEAERQLRAASGQKHLGRFQLEAAIQSVHAERARTGRIEWQAIALLYEGLVRTAPTLGAQVGRAAATAEVDGPETGLTMLEELRSPPAETYQPYWAVRAHLLARLGRSGEARDAYARAIALTDDDAMRAFLVEGKEGVETDRA
jgi:RNA polymerase sigma-70 factor (ECF subfamily)